MFSFLIEGEDHIQACSGLHKDVDGKLVHGGGVSNLHCDVEEQQAIDVDEEEIFKETEEGGGGNLNLPSGVEAELSETGAEGVDDIVTEEISEYEKIRAVNVKQKLLRKLKGDWDGFKEGEGFLTGGRRKGAKKLKIVEKEVLNLRGEEDQQSGKSTKQNLGLSGTGLDI